MLPGARRIVRRFLWAAALAGAFAVLVLWILHLETSQRWLWIKARNAAANRGIDLAAQVFRFNLVEGTARAEGLRLTKRGHPIPFITADRLAIRWNYRRLREGLNALAQLEINGAAVRIVRNADGTFNLPESSGPSEPIEGLPQFVTLRRVALTYEDGPVVASLPNLSGTLQGSEWKLQLNSPGSAKAGNPPTAFVIDRVQLQGRMPQLTLAAITATGNLAVHNEAMSLRTSAAFSGASLRLDLANLSGTAKVDQVEARLEGSASLSFRDEASFLNAKARLAGFLTDARLTWPGMDFEKLRGKGPLISERKDVRLESGLDFDGDGIRAVIRSASGYGVNGRGAISLAIPSLAIAVQIEGTVPSLAEVLDEEQIDGSVQFKTKVSGTVRSPRAEIQASSRDLRAGPIEEIRTTVAATYANSVLHIPGAHLYWGDEEATVAGDVQFRKSGPILALDVSANDVRLERIIDNLESDIAASGTVSLTATIQGPASAPQVAANLEAEDLVAWGERFGRLSAEASYDNSLLELTRFHLEKPQASGFGELDATGRIDIAARTYAARIDTNNFRLESARFSGIGPLQGSVDIHGQGEGSLDDPRGSATLTAESPELGRLIGSATLRRDGMAFAIESSRLNLAPFDVPARAAISVNGEAPWGDLKNAVASATIRDLEYRLADIEIVSKGPVELRVEKQALQAKRVLLEAAGGEVSVAGQIPFFDADPTKKLTISGQIPLEAATRFVPEDLGLALSGRASLGGTVEGSLKQPAPDLTIGIVNVSASVKGVKSGAEEIRAEIRVRPDAITLESLEARIAGGKIQAAGSAPLDGGDITASLEFDGVDPLLFLPQPTKLRGRISGRAEIQANERDWTQATGQLRFRELSATGPNGRALTQQQDTLVTLRLGEIATERIVLRGPSSAFTLQGSVGLLGARPLKLRLDGSLESEVLNQASSDFGLAGPVEVHLDVIGTVDDPQLRGGLTLKDGRLVLGESFPAAMDRIDLAVRFEGREVRIDRLQAGLNGGRFNAEGGFSLAKGTIDTVDLKVRGRSVFLEYPKGLQTASNFDVTLKSVGRNLVLGGRVALLDAVYRDDINVLNVAARGLAAGPNISGDPNPLLARLRFDVEVVTREPLAVDNNLGRINANANLRLLGTPQRPAVTGRFEIEEGGRVYFSGRTFTVNQGVIDFVDETRISPRFDLQAVTRVSDYEVALKLTGDLDKTETTFTAEPSLNEDQILSLLFTGSIDNTGKGAAYAQTQLLTLFGSGLTGGISSRLRNTFGLSEFRIDPGLITADSNPTARLTVGQSFTPEFRITYSTDLTNGQDQIWTAEYDWRRRFLARFFRETNQSNRLELRQRIRLGGGPNAGDFSSRPRRPKQVIGSVTIEGNPVFEQSVVLKKLKLKPGKTYDFLRLQKSLERLKAFYAEKGYAEARIQQNRRQRDGRLHLTFEIDAGEQVRFVFEGANPSGKLKRQVARVWQRGIIDRQRLGTVARAVRQDFMRSGFADVKVAAQVKDAGGIKTVVVEIERGTNFGRPKLSFPGASPGVATELASDLRRSKLDREIKAGPEPVLAFVRGQLRKMGYLAATLGEPTSSIDGKNLNIAIPVVQGPEFVLGSVAFEGTSQMQEHLLREAIVMEPGDKYVPEDRFAISQRTQQAYWNAGYRKADVDAEERLDAATGRANLTIRVSEGRKFAIAAIRIEGRSETSEAYVRKRLSVEEGNVLDASRINDSRKNLLDSGAYNLIDFTFPSADSPSANEQTVDLVIRVREPKPYRLDFGGTYDTDRGFGVIGDISTVNTLGEARTLGFRTVADRLKQDYRLYFSQPFLGGKRIITTSALYSTRQILGGFETLEAGLAIQQQVRFKRKLTLNYGYNYRYADSTVRSTRQTETGRTSAAITSLSRDTRDNVLDATRGSFISSAVEYGPSFLGGNVPYYRYYQQAMKYFGLRKPTLMPFEGERKRSHTVFAASARVGFADSLGGLEILPVDRFFAGGGTTIRGYAQNSVGPKLPDGTAIGGRATVVLNNELRFPLYKFFDGVAFVDTGNVWASPSELRLTDMRTGAGFGLRVRNPFVLIRFDYGWKVGRRPGESMGAFFFSIGQAF